MVQGRNGKSTKPTFEDAEKLSAEYESLFKREEPPGESLPLHVEPFNVDDNPPDEMEIVKALWKMNTGKSPRATGIKVEDLRQWHFNARISKEKTQEDIQLWEKVLELINLAFEEGEIP